MKRVTKDDLLRLSQKHGFSSFADMCEHVETCHEKEALAIDLMRLENLIKEPLSQEKAELPMRNGLADVPVDASGLPQLNDLILTIARLIVRLLFGYTADEIQFLRDRALDIEAKHVHENHYRAQMVSGLRRN